MLVVSDASPLNILIRIERVGVLPKLFGRVWIPPAVVDEMCSPSAPGDVRVWAGAMPAWIGVQSPRSLPQSADLGIGERAAIGLALEIHADYFLVDDRQARRCAQQLGLRVTGTLGILELAAQQGLLDFRTTIAALQATDFRISSQLLNEALSRWP